MSYADDWGKVWNKSVTAFTRAKRHLIPELDDVYNGTPGLIKSLDKLDKSDPRKFSAPRQVKEKKQALSDSNKEFKKGFKKEKTKYAKAVDVAIKKTDKVLHKEPYRELKVIRAHLDWIEKAIENNLSNLSKDVQKMDKEIGKKIEKTQEKLRKKGAGDDVVNQSTQFLKFARLLVTFPTAAKTAAAKANKAIQVIKADPTPKTYNDEMSKGGRNYTQQINNAIALANHAECPEDLTKQLSGLMKYDSALKEFGGGKKWKVAQTADKKAVLALVKEYSQLVKATNGYVAVVSKYITKNKKKLGMK